MSLRNKMIKQKEMELANEFFLYVLAAPVVLCGVVAYAMEWMDAKKAKKEKSKFEEYVDKIPAKIPLTATPPKSLIYLYNILGSADDVIKNCDQMLNLTINNNLESNYKMNNSSLKKLVNNIKVDNFKNRVFDLDALDEYFYYALEDKFDYSDSELDKIVADVSNSFKFNLKLVKLNGFGILKDELWFNLLFAVDVSYKFEGKEYKTKFPFVEDIALKIEEKDVKDIPEKELEKIYTYFNTKVIPNKNRIKNKKALDAPIEIKDVENFGPLGYKIDEYLSYHQTGCCWFAENNVLELIPSGEFAKESLELDPSSEQLNLSTDQHIEYINSLNLNDSLTTEQFNNLTKALDGLGLEYDKNELIYSNNREELILEASYGIKYDVKKFFNRIFRTSDQLINQYRSLADLKNMDNTLSMVLVEAGAANRFGFSIFIILVMKDLFRDVREKTKVPFTEQDYGSHNYQKLIKETINNFDLAYIEDNILASDDLKNLLRIENYCESITNFLNKQNISNVEFDGYIGHNKFFKLIETSQFGKTIKNIENKIIDLQKVISNAEKTSANDFCKKYYKALMTFNKIIHILPNTIYNKYKRKND